VSASFSFCRILQPTNFVICWNTVVLTTKKRDPFKDRSDVSCGQHLKLQSQQVTEKQLSYSVSTQAHGSLDRAISCSNNNTMTKEQTKCKRLVWKDPAAASLVALPRYLEGLTKTARNPSNAGLLPRFERRTSQTQRGRVSGLCTHILTRVFESVSECGRVRFCNCVCESSWAYVRAWGSVCNRSCERECVSVSEKYVWVCKSVRDGAIPSLPDCYEYRQPIGTVSTPWTTVPAFRAVCLSTVLVELPSAKNYYYYYYYYHLISHFSALAGKYSPLLGCSNQQN